MTAKFLAWGDHKSKWPSLFEEFSAMPRIHTRNSVAGQSWGLTMGASRGTPWPPVYTAICHLMMSSLSISPIYIRRVSTKCRNQSTSCSRNGPSRSLCSSNKSKLEVVWVWLFSANVRGLKLFIERHASFSGWLLSFSNAPCFVSDLTVLFGHRNFLLEQYGSLRSRNGGWPGLAFSGGQCV